MHTHITTPCPPARLNVVHCDLKPENILLRERGKTAVKVRGGA